MRRLEGYEQSTDINGRENLLRHLIDVKAKNTGHTELVEGRTSVELVGLEVCFLMTSLVVKWIDK